MKLPQNVAFLERYIRRMFASEREAYRMRVSMANVVLAQMLPGGVVRGGTLMNFRYGPDRSRFTMDFDMAQKVETSVFKAELETSLASGWSEFTGKIVPAPRAKSVKRIKLPEEYLMTPFYVKLSYRHHPWCTVKLEMSPNEIGDADAFEETPVPDNIAKAFVSLGFPVPDPVKTMTLPYQIAQKVHGTTKPNNQRARDLVDLQLIARHSKVPYKKAGLICRRLFAYRKQQPWPSNVAYGPNWESLYAAAATGVDVLPTLEAAVPWGNAFIAKLYRYSTGEILSSVQKVNEKSPEKRRSGRWHGFC